MQKKVFHELIAPLTDYIKQSGSKIDEKSGSRVLFFEDFVKVLIFGLSIGAGGLRKLILELSTNSAAQELGLPTLAYSTFHDGFTRFKELFFNELYKKILS